MILKEILANYEDFQKQRGGNPLTTLLAKGLVDVEGDQWVKHRKIINPAFHVEKLKVLFILLPIDQLTVKEKFLTNFFTYNSTLVSI